MNYEEMSDFEVNKLVAEKHLKLFVNELRSGGRLNSDIWLFDSEGLVRYTNYNPCNNPSDAWPIIVENKIGIMHNWNKEGYWSAISPKSGCDYDCNGRNPLRAAMICFLKMKDAENAN